MVKEKPPIVKRLLRSKAVIVFEVLLLVMVSSALAKEIVRRYQIQSEINKLQSEVDKLEQGRVELENLIGYFNSDTYKEEQARLKLGLQKEGESVITVLGESTEEVEAANDTVSQLAYQDEKNSNPQKWWDYFFNIKKER